MHLRVESFQQRQWQEYVYVFVDDESGNKLFACQSFEAVIVREEPSPSKNIAQVHLDYAGPRYIKKQYDYERFEPQNDILRDDHIIDAWRGEVIMRGIWSFPPNDPPRRDLEIWLGDLFNPFDGVRLKIYAYNVSALGCDKIWWHGIAVHMEVHIGDDGQYIFLNTNDDRIVLFECSDFDSRFERVAYDQV